ncbi:MAG: carbonic anhydrase family protein [Gammaproteobacteria bacterium]|nr:carbonic anhydrase family protein [Gammaproteobacteria bacterium]MBU0771249.1 carbonic anhydrase family protein [Gammaproteobacteria bacterium]MBU0858142.1 carbonic anhydrase family protein [Gammaproteobacteria bacterium]MBU1847185.1 carbonic anhydrase family protein [Gammaproteobacteria bacterium]
MKAHFTVRFLFLSLLAGLAAGSLQAADWHTISTERGKKIEIDRDSVLRAEGGKKVAWGRLVLTDADAQKTGYAMVQALNRYDCQSLKFATIKRVYLDANLKILREERTGSDSEISLLPGTLDEKLFREVCQPPAPEELRQVAEQAGRAALTAAAAADTGHVERAEFVNIKPDLREAAAQAKEEMGAKAKAGAEGAPDKAKAAAAAHAAPAREAPAAKPPVVSRSEIPLPMPAPAPRKRAPRAKPAPVAALEPAHAAKGAPEAPHHGDIHWSYEGAFGPENWGKLKPEWAQCGEGRTQSPIDIRDGIKVDLPPIVFDYRTTYFTIIDNGHTVQVNVGEGSTITVSGKRYELLQFHFHKPSEERVNGRNYDMVAHLVHKDYDGRLAVVAVLIERGMEHPLFNTIWAYLPLQKNVESRPDVSIDLANLLPAGRDYFTFMGSLTTPPCSEGVTWMVMKEPLQLSQEQIGIFSHLYRNNARPVQAANSRLIKQSR